MYLPNDIIIRKALDDETVWVSQRLIVASCRLSDDYIWKVRALYKHSLPQSWQKLTTQSEFFLGDNPDKSWRWGRKGGQYYYDIDRIPNRKPTCYRDMLPSKEELISMVDDSNTRAARERDREHLRMIENGVDALMSEDDTMHYRLHANPTLSVAVARDLSQALAWCRFMTTNVKQHKALGVTTIEKFYELCLEVLTPLKLTNMRVSTTASLRKKVATFPTDQGEQREWMISGKVGNDNRRIVGKHQLVDTTTGEIFNMDYHLAVMYRCYMNPGSPVKDWMCALYEKEYVPAIEALGEMPIALRTFKSHLRRLPARLKTERMRHGEDYYNKKYLTYCPSEALTYAHSLFCGDGSGLVAYRYYTSAGVLKLMNLYTMLISDVASGDIVGYAFSDEGTHTETLDLVRRAVRQAVANGGNQTMFEFVSDNHGAFTSDESKDYLRGVFNKVRTIAVGNSQANPAEMQFRLFKNAVLRPMKNFIRSSHTASIGGRANLDNITKADYPTYDETIVMVENAIRQWNTMERRDGVKAPAELFQHKHPDCKPMSPRQLRLINGRETKVEVGRMRGFVDVSTAKGGKIKRYKFEIPDYWETGSEAISKATGRGYDNDVRVMWDETGADLYSLNGQFILTCPPASLGTTAAAERTDEHREAERHNKARKAAQMQAVERHEGQIEMFDYTTHTLMGGTKESYNEMQEQSLDNAIPAQAPTQTPAQKPAKKRFDAAAAAMDQF